MKITPIKTGTIHCNKSIITLGRDFDQWIDVPATAWLVETARNKVLVDTGMCDSERASRYHYPGSVQAEDERIDKALAKRGVSTDDVDTVIFTHLHWDHCAHASLFRKAAYVIQKNELDFARRPIPPYYHSYESDEIGLESPFKPLTFQIVDGDREIVPGVAVLATFGHSPGHQSVLVKTEKGRYVISGDAVMSYDNLAPDPKKGIAYTMIGRYVDFIQAWRSFEKISNHADCVLPAHDFRVFDRASYP